MQEMEKMQTSYFKDGIVRILTVSRTEEEVTKSLCELAASCHEVDEANLCSEVTYVALPSASHFKGKDICAPLTPLSRNTKQATAFDQLRNTKNKTGVGATTQEAETCRYLEQAVERRDTRFCEV